MKYLLLNISFEASSVLEDIMDNKVLKEIPFGSKFKTPVLSYGSVLIPYNLSVDLSDTDFKLMEGLIFSRCTSPIEITQEMIYSIYTIIKEIVSRQKSMTIDILNIIDSDHIGITYSDGSSSKKKNAAGFGVCKLTEQSTNGVYDNFSGKLWNYITFSGRIENGTNNIGELTGVKTSLMNLGNEPIQLIISDSEYSIKTFREYVYVWKNNGWLTYSKKPIKNKELIQETYNELLNQLGSKVVLFKWVKGHADDPFNEICDELAKKESGVEE